MSRKYDVVDRLRRKNERPIIIIDEEHTFKINSSKTNVLGIMHLTKQNEKKKKEDVEDDFKLADEIIRLALGKEALDYIYTLDPTLAYITDIVNIIMAAISDEELKEDIETKEKK